MKKIIYTLSLLLMSVLSVKAQDFVLTEDKNSGEGYYEEVVQIPNVSQQDLYQRAKEWIIANFKTADNNIGFDEKEFSIVNSGAFKVDQKKTMGWAVYDGTTDFKFHVWLKDGKYKFRIDNVSFHILYASWPDGMKTKTENYSDLGDSKMGKYLKEQANDNFGALVKAFKGGMAKQQTQKKNDW